MTNTKSSSPLARLSRMVRRPAPVVVDHELALYQDRKREMFVPAEKRTPGL